MIAQVFPKLLKKIVALFMGSPSTHVDYRSTSVLGSQSETFETQSLWSCAFRVEYLPAEWKCFLWPGCEDSPAELCAQWWQASWHGPLWAGNLCVMGALSLSSQPSLHLIDIMDAGWRGFVQQLYVTGFGTTQNSGDRSFLTEEVGPAKNRVTTSKLVKIYLLSNKPLVLGPLLLWGESLYWQVIHLLVW